MKKFLSVFLSVLMIMSIITLPSGIVAKAAETPGIVLSEHDIVLEEGETCIVFASRYGLIVQFVL